MRRVGVAGGALVVVLAAVAVLGCSGRTGGSAVPPASGGPSTVPAAVGDKAAYCLVAAELATKRAAAVEAVAGRGDVEAHLAFQRFARDHLGRAEELERVAPGEIRAELAKVVVGLRRVAEGETTAFQEKKVFLADARVQRYDAKECGVGATPATTSP